MVNARSEDGGFSLRRVDMRTLHSSGRIDVGAALKHIAEVIVA
jgi:hypothetical protein